jgi:hypothetical protein
MTVSVEETVTYSFYIESDNVMKEGLFPVFVNFINISDNSEKTSTPSIFEVGAGFYKFSYAWSQTVDPKAYLLKIDTTLTNPSEKHVTMRIEKVDYVSAAVQRIVDIEQGTLKVENNQLIILHASDQTIELGRWDLFDSSGVNATSTNPFYRVAVNVASY